MPLNDSCPTSTVHTDGKLKFLFSIIGPIDCTERGCNFNTLQGPWFRKRHSLLKHLENVHDLTLADERKNIVRWCMICQTLITQPKVTTHYCMRNLKERIGREINYTTLTHEQYQNWLSNARSVQILPQTIKEPSTLTNVFTITEDLQIMPQLQPPLTILLMTQMIPFSLRCPDLLNLKTSTPARKCKA